MGRTGLVQVAAWATVQILLSIRSMVQSALVVSLRAFASIILFLKKSLYFIIDSFSLSVFKSMLPLCAVAFLLNMQQSAGQ